MSSPSAGSSSSSSGARLSQIVLDERTRDMTVQQWWEDFAAQAEQRAQALVDEAVDALLLAHKEEGEQIRNLQHERRLVRERERDAPGGAGAGPAPKRGAGAKKAAAAAAAAASSSASSSSSAAPPPVWDVEVTVLAAADASKVTGVPVVLRPYSLRQEGAAAGAGAGAVPRMCRIGRSAAADFQPPLGLSLSFDSSVTLWHGKVTCLQGRVFYTDLGSSNGSQLEGQPLAAHEPHELRSGSRLSLGEVELGIRLVPVAAPK